jgi:hypothetical protein
MSYNPDSVSSGQQFSASKGSTGRSSQNPQAGWNSQPSELKHQPGRNVASENTVEILPKGTHLPPDRTFLPQNPERNVPESARQDTIGGGLSNDQIQDTFIGATSKDVYSGMGLPSNKSQIETKVLGDGGRKKNDSGLAQYGDSEI